MDKDLKKFQRSCRLCAEVQDVWKPGCCVMIFSKESENMRLLSKLNKYLLIEIEEDDKLPKIICNNCCSNLQMVSNFIEGAHKAQAILLERSYALEPLPSIDATPNLVDIKTVKTEPLSEDEGNDDGMEISVDPMMVLQNSDDLPSPVPESEHSEHNSQLNEEIEHIESEEDVDVTHLHSVDSQTVSIKLLRKGSNNGIKIGVLQGKIGNPAWKPFPCVTCRRSFYTELALKNHSWIHVNEEKVTKQYRCSICHEEYEDKTALIDHLKMHRMSGMCSLCGRIFRSERNLAAHMAVHLTSGKSFTCKVCGRSYNTKSNLKTHSITHSTLRPYECHICKKSFKRNQDLKFHINQHTGAKPYKCPFCDKCFASSGNCYSHRSRMHPGKFVEANQAKRRVQVNRTQSAVIAPAPVSVKGVMKYQCQLCDHSFLKKENFTYHMFQHTGEKPFRCKYCEENFVTRKGLLLHHDKKHPSQNRPLALISKNVLLK